MTFDWLEFARLADDLEKDANSGLGNPRREALLRSAISRRYYALHCQVRNLSIPKGFIPHKSADVHKDLVDFLYRSSDRSVRTMGFKLDTLRKHRNDADYEDAIRSIDYLLEKSHEVSKVISNALRTY